MRYLPCKININWSVNLPSKGFLPSNVSVFKSYILIVDDSIVEKVCKIIEEEAYTGENTDGIIVISNIGNVFNIGTKKKDSEAL